jgi:hypothetical protein
VDGILFKKTFGAHTSAIHPDNNSNAELYCNEEFVELESLGPLVKLKPGAEVNHRETWEAFEGLETLPGNLQTRIPSS